MKSVEKKKACLLRSEGYSIKEISLRLGVAKGSVSVWVRNVELSDTQKRRLSEKGHSTLVIEKRRKSRLDNEEKKRNVIIQNASTRIGKIRERDLFFIGISLYWGEGSKTKRGSVEFSNSDPRLIEIMMRFFSIICVVPKEKYRGHVYLHPHLDATRAEKYWSRISGIPLKQFHKTTQQHNKASQNKKDSLPYGTFSIGVYDTKLFLNIKGWMDGVYENIPL